MIDVYAEKLRPLITGENRRLLDLIGRAAQLNLTGIVNVFYSEMLGNPEATLFLDNELVATRLTGSLKQWLAGLFAPIDETGIPAFIERQRAIGRVHARINIPMHLVVEGMRIMRRELGQCLTATDIERGDLVRAVVLVNELLDHVMSLINESYISDIMMHERNLQSLRLRTMPHNLALECERLHSALFDWQRQVMTDLFYNPPTDAMPTLRRSEFGLWLHHKAPLLFRDLRPVEELRRQVQVIDESLHAVCAMRALGDTRAFDGKLKDFTENVSETAWMLANLIDQIMEMENGRDALTRLFNRRFLPTILQHETAISMKHKLRYAILLFDVDHFKKINDTYGHDCGDVLLREVAETLAHNVRANDYVFRYGGEEFLVVLGDVDEARALQLAEKLRLAIARRSFVLKPGLEAHVTVSCGVALHDGHPDYQRVITCADEAVYEAKRGGRNRSVLADAVGAKPAAGAA